MKIALRVFAERLYSVYYILIFKINRLVGLKIGWKSERELETKNNHECVWLICGFSNDPHETNLKLWQFQEPNHRSSTLLVVIPK